jgi:Ca2+-dependent lipid-binding protein
MAENDSNSPVLRHAGQHKVDRVSVRAIKQIEKWQQKILSPQQVVDGGATKKPAGGFDATPIPYAPPGYTLKITFHRANNLPSADFPSFTSDPYILATLKTSLSKRHKQDPDLRLRVPTIHRNTNPVWNVEWTVANVPASGFFLKCRLYDEDPADHDDRLGNAHIDITSISDSWKGFKEQQFELKKRMGSKRAYLIRGCAVMFRQRSKMSGDLIVSVENLGRTPGEGGGCIYTISPLPWSRHYSPLIGLLTGIKTSEKGKDGHDINRYKYV